MIRHIFGFALALFSASDVSAAPGPVPTGASVRIGSEIRYYYGCNTNSNTIEPGDAGASVLNLTACASYAAQTTPGPSWVIVPGVVYGDVYVSGSNGGEHFTNCNLIRSQLTSGMTTTHQTITIECTGFEILRSGFD